MTDYRSPVPSNSPAIGGIRAIRGIDAEAVRAAVLERVLRAAMEELRRRALLEQLARVHDGASRGRPLPVVADELRRLGEELVA